MPTCESDDVECDDAETCLRGCFCEDGLVLDTESGECIKKDDCSEYMCIFQHINLQPMLKNIQTSDVFSWYYMYYFTDTECKNYKWVVVVKKRLNAYNTEILSQKLSSNECRSKCEAASWGCLSIDYRPSQKICVLSEADRSMSYLRNYQGGSWNYHERQCIGELHAV